MPGIDAAVLGLHDEHVAAVPLGDDLLLQVLRRVLAAQVRLERAAQPRPLLAQPVADQLQLRARVVDHVAGRRRSSRASAAVSPLNDAAPPLAASRSGNDRRRAADRGARLVHRLEERRRARAAAAASSARPSTASAASICGRSLDARSGTAPLAARYRTRLGRRGRAAARPSAASVDGAQARQALGAHRRQREAADRLDDPIEFEGPQGSWLHT